MQAEVLRSEYQVLDDGGQEIEIFWTRPCVGCGVPTTFVGVRAEGRDESLGQLMIGNRTVRWGRGSECPACAARREIAGRFPVVETRPYDRGVRRRDVEQAADWNRASGSAMGALAAEVLAEILADTSGERITKSAMRAHRFGDQVEPIIVNFDDDASPEGALFRTGPVTCGSMSGLPAISRTLGEYIDRHCRGDLGAFGPVPAGLSDRARFALALGTPGDHARAALDSGRGVVHGRFEARHTFYDGPGSAGRETDHLIRVWTFLNDGHSTTVVYSHPG